MPSSIGSVPTVDNVGLKCWNTPSPRPTVHPHSYSPPRHKAVPPSVLLYKTHPGTGSKLWWRKWKSKWRLKVHLARTDRACIGTIEAISLADASPPEEKENLFSKKIWYVDTQFCCISPYFDHCAVYHVFCTQIGYCGVKPACPLEHVVSGVFLTV